MRICLVSFAFPPLSGGGVSTQTFQLASHLSREGIEVHVLAAGVKDEEDCSSGLFKVTRLKVPFYSKIRKLPAFEFRVWRWLRANRGAFDVIHFQSSCSFVYLLFEKSHNVVQTCHHSQLRAFRADLRFMLKSPGATLVYLPGIVLALQEVLALRRVNNIVAISDTLRSELLSYRISPTRITVIPNGTDEVSLMEKKEKEVPAGNLKFLFAGRLYPIKGIDTVMEAVKILSGKGIDNFSLDIAGDGPLCGYCEKEIRRNNLHHCRVLRDVVGHQIENMYRTADCLIVPSRHEGFCIVLLEGVANDLAVIANDIPTFREFYPDDEVLYFKRDDPYDLAEKMIVIITSPELCASLPRKAKDRVRDFTWQNIAKSYVDLYSRVVDQQESGQR